MLCYILQKVIKLYLYSKLEKMAIAKHCNLKARPHDVAPIVLS